LSLKKAHQNAGLSGKTALLLSSWFGIGLMPKAPGTYGTLAALPPAIAMNYFGAFYSGLFLVIFIAISIWASGLSEKLLGRDDPSEVVIDEVAGFLVTMFLLPSFWISFCAGFFMFRFFDILKPYPIKDLERLKGGTGIVLDDLLAGIYANLGVRIFFLFFN